MAEKLIRHISCTVDERTLIWKHPTPAFAPGADLSVQATQEALLVYEGQPMDLLPCGKYKLNDSTAPKLFRAIHGVFNMLFRQKEGIPCEIYFISKTVHPGIKWGTGTRIRLKDPATGIAVSFGANGMLSLHVTDATALVMKLSGQKELFPADDSLNESNDRILKHIRSVVVTKVRSVFTQVIQENRWDVFEIDTYQERLACCIQGKLNSELAVYGLEIPDFSILSISTPEDILDPTDAEKEEQQIWTKIRHQKGHTLAGVGEEQTKEEIARAAQGRKLVEAETEAKIRMIQAQGEAESLKIRGYAEAEVLQAKGVTEKDRMAYDVQKSMADSLGKLQGGNTYVDLSGFGKDLNFRPDLSNLSGSAPGRAAASQAAPQGLSSSQAVPQSFTSSQAAPQGLSSYQPAAAPGTAWTCACGQSGNTGRFCSNCGKERPEPALWDCPRCGAKRISGRFCSECGSPRPC